MNAAHFHLIVNHLPVIGFLAGTLTWIIAGAVRKESGRRTALCLLVGAGITAIPTYLSGVPAEEMIEHAAGVLHSRIEFHEELARGGLLMSILVAALAAVALVYSLCNRELPRGSGVILGALAVLCCIRLLMVAEAGGEIRHPEIRRQQAGPIFQLGHEDEGGDDESHGDE